MASPDLYAQKILGTDPRVGFGDSFVLPPITRGFDDTLYQHIGAVASREQQARQQQMKMAYDNAKLANVDSPGKGNYDIQRVRSQYIGQMQEMINTGNFAPTTALSMESALNELKALDKREHDVFLANDKLVDEFQSKYGDRYLGGQAKEINRNIYFGTPNDQSYYRNATQVASTLDPSQNVNLYDAQRSRQVFVDNYSKGLQQSISSGSTIEDEFSKKHTENSFAGTFLTKDSKGNWIPGVDDRHVKEYFTFDDGITKKWYDNQTANAFLKDTETIYKQAQQDPTNPANSKFANMTQEEVYTKILESNPLKSGQSFGEYSFNSAKRDLETYNKIKRDTSYSREDKEQQLYSNGGNKELKTTVTPTTYQHQFWSTDGKTTGNSLHEISGITIDKNGLPLKPIPINPAGANQASLGRIPANTTGNYGFAPLFLGLSLYTPQTGKFYRNPPGATIDEIKKAIASKDYATLKRYSNLVLTPIAAGQVTLKSKDATLAKQSGITPGIFEEEDADGNITKYYTYTDEVLIPLTGQNRYESGQINSAMGWRSNEDMMNAILSNPETKELYDLINFIQTDYNLIKNYPK